LPAAAGRDEDEDEEEEEGPVEQAARAARRAEEKQVKAARRARKEREHAARREEEELAREEFKALATEYCDRVNVRRHRLLAQAANLKLPPNPLDKIIDQLGGPLKVAEMTGRKGRFVTDGEGGQVYLRRNAQQECSMAEINLTEKRDFQAGRKLSAIISEAASSGTSLHADKRAENKRQRMHITIELAASASSGTFPPSLLPSLLSFFLNARI